VKNHPQKPNPTRRELLSQAVSGFALSSRVLASDYSEEAAMSAAQEQPNNDTSRLIPVTALPGKTLRFDFPGLHIGAAEYAEGPTGCTVFHFPKGALAALDARGGAVGTYMPGDGGLDALCYAGGSLYGLEACAGVAAELMAQSGYKNRWDSIALVRGAVIFDFGGRGNAVYPDKALGRAALKAAKPGVFPLGPRGAGRSATAGKGFDFNWGESAGQGGAFRQAGPTKVAVFTVVNAIGAIFNRQGQIVRGNLDRKTGRRTPLTEDLERRLVADDAIKPPGGNTTLTAVITNQKLGMYELTQLGRQVHSAMARAIQPFHCLDDGDVLYTVTTGEVENPKLRGTALGVLASELAWDAVLSSFA
jgi:L-aminopeptidase/D-esterase-like protein